MEVKNSIIIEIKNEYKKIDYKWLKLEYYTFIGLVFLGFIIECIFAIFLYTPGDIKISFDSYVIKYIIFPLVFNSCLMLVGILVMHSPLNQCMKSYIISLLFIGVCFLFYSVHHIFGSIYLIFTLPILLTLIYSNYTLTTVISFISIIAKIVSELFVKWDSEKINPFNNIFSSMNFVISTCIMFLFYVVCFIVIYYQREKNNVNIQKEIERHQMQKELITDELTKIYNRTALRIAFQDMEEDKSGDKYVFVMIDLDNFKTLNDTLGHEKGDQCLKEFGRILKINCTEAAPFRYGGDEFCIIFKNKTLEDIMQTCRSIQNDLNHSTVNKSGILTVSIGIAQYKNTMSATELLQNTDSALYRSKKSKNSICVYENEEIHSTMEDLHESFDSEECSS